MHSILLPKPFLPSNAAFARRLLWAAATSTNSSLKVAVSECTDNINAVLKRHGAANKQSKTRDSCFALVSQSFSAAEVETVAQMLRDRFSEADADVAVAGAVVDRVATTSSCHGSSGLSDGVSMLYHRPEPGSCPEAVLEARPFYIGDMHGRQRLREVAVGRWHNAVTDRFRDHQSLVQWKDGQSSVTQAASHLRLPEELELISDPSAVELVLMAADNDSTQVFDALDSRFPQAIRLAIVGSQTPFFNGREHTLFDGNGLYESGVVGVAFVRRQGAFSARGSRAAEQPQVSYTGLRAISDVLEIRRSKGNVVLEVENGEAAHQLIASIRKQRISEGASGATESRLFAKITSSRDSASGGVVLQVTGGDPTKGGLAIDTTKDIEPGHFIQFMMLDSLPCSASSPESIGRPVLRFGASDYSGIAEPAHGDTSVVPRVFGGATEGGFVYNMSSAMQDTGFAAKSSNGIVKSVLAGSAECSVPGSNLVFNLDD